MIIIIDAYNLLKTLYHNTELDEKSAYYQGLLKQYAKKRKNTLILVYDGGSSPWQSSHKEGALTIIHSGFQETADDVIMQYIQAHKDKDILVVSADREIAQKAYECNIVSIEPFLFDAYVQQAVSNKTPVQEVAKNRVKKLRPEETHEIDTLMEQASAIIERKHDEQGDKSRSQSSGSVLSKRERKIRAQLKKL
ncbi:MAG: NYN domain-containing protein [Candidatus Babeliales bacterium]